MKSDRRPAAAPKGPSALISDAIALLAGAPGHHTGRILIVRIPMRFQRRGGRKRIVAPDGSAIVLTSKPPQPDATLVKALARAHRWQRVLEDGEYGTLAELSAAERISRSYICRVLRLTLLAPDIIERVMDGGLTAGLAGLLQPFQVEWDKQREQLLTR